MTYSEVLANARTCIGQYCKACPVCNGVACKNQIPGPGAKGVGDTAIRNYNKWADIRVNMDTLCENGTPDTGVELFGKTFKYPFFAGPVGAVNLHYSDTYTDMTYNDVLVRACAENGIAAFTGIRRNTTYDLRETRAPSGYMTAGPWILVVRDEDATLYPATENPDGTLTQTGETGTTLTVSGTDPKVLSVTVRDISWGYELPDTGGAGTTSYTAGGLALIFGAVTLMYIHCKRRKEDEASS